MHFERDDFARTRFPNPTHTDFVTLFNTFSPARLRRFKHRPWRDILRVTGQRIVQRFKAERLGLTAGGLTLTTLIALVPFISVALAVFTAFPMFAKLQGTLQNWLLDSLIPDNIAKQVLGYVTLFSTKARGLGAMGLVILLITALSLMMTIDRTLNQIWQVKRQRPLAARLLLYWAGLTVLPLLLGGVLTLSSYALSASRGWVALPLATAQGLFNGLEFALFALCLTALYFFVPNTRMRWTHALSGALLAALAIEGGKKILVWYLSKIATYTTIYGAFATVPILLIWVYLAWVVVLLGAMVAAYLPSVLRGLRHGRRASFNHGDDFALAVEVLQRLNKHGLLKPAQLAQKCRVDPLELEPALTALLRLGWVGQLDEPEAATGQGSWVLLQREGSTPLLPLMEALLLPAHRRLAWLHLHWTGLNLADVWRKMPMKDA